AIYSTTQFTKSSTSTIKPGEVAEIQATTTNTSISVPPAGTPVIIEVTTIHGVQATYQATWP
ncbi:MAG: hypothetical protein F7B61_00785, partial [Caldisphaeraceae archaeon]|nr:hypothetical protein [Caldisphaeraceae archaeon]